MKNNSKTSRIDRNIEIVKTLEKKAPKTMQDIKIIQKEQEKYKKFLRKQARERYNYIETQSFSTI
ncbi:MAG: hypothetical protein FJZ07_01415 [Candidatus Nealsonbacteria bacterium]|nr:hypothetical protein [Candidatus Nealsonbacteria bacterium]